MPRDDKEAFDKCKAMCKSGLWQPLTVAYDMRQGYYSESSLVKSA